MKAFFFYGKSRSIVFEAIGLLSKHLILLILFDIHGVIFLSCFVCEYGSRIIKIHYH